MQNRTCQQLFRDRQKAKREAGKVKQKGVKMVKLSAHGSGDGNAIEDFASLSRAGKNSDWRKSRNGKQNGVIRTRASRTNWYHPYLWSAINLAGPKNQFSSTAIVKFLKNTNPTLYSSLEKGTVHRWIRKDKKGWTDKTIQNVKNRSSLHGSGRVGYLTPHPTLVEEIKKELQGIRSSGIEVTRILGRSVMIAIIEKRQPDLLKSFKVSETFVGQFFDSVMKWSIRSGTQAVAHLPDDFAISCERAFHRIVYLVREYDIPSRLIINFDQTGLLLLTSRNKTYEQRGARDVKIAAKGEKRAFTLYVASTPAGDILPFQAVWAGKTDHSLPKCPEVADAQRQGIIFTPANSGKRTSHFSTLHSMKIYVTDVLQPYIKSVIDEMGLPSTQKAVFYIDVYPVHSGLPFRSFFFKEAPNVFLVFVPANCTSIFQPADVGLNRVIKHFMRQETLEYLVKSFKNQIDRGCLVEQVKFSSSLPELRNATVQPIIRLYDYFRSYEGSLIIKRAWEKCQLNVDLNLGEKCLFNPKTREINRQYIRQDATLRKEIEDKVGPLGLDSDSIANGDAAIDGNNSDSDHEDSDSDMRPGLGKDNLSPQGLEDDTGVPLQAVVNATLGRQFFTSSGSHEVSTFILNPNAIEEDNHQNLQVVGEMENLWSYNDRDGRVWSDILAEGPGGVEEMEDMYIFE